MPNYRKLTQFEINVAATVFQQTINYNNVYIADTFIPFNDGTPVTLMHDQSSPLGSVHVRYWFAIYWGITVYQNGTDKGFDAFGRNLANTLIHELTHVWQGQHGVPYLYMIQSMVAQGKAILQYRNRHKAYEYDHNNYQRWKDYNVEQQAYIIENWYDPQDGNQSLLICDIHM